MIKKVAVAVAVLVLLVVAAWALVPAPASAVDCTFESKAKTTFSENRVQILFEGHLPASLHDEVRRHWFGMAFDDTGCGLSAEVVLEPPAEPGTFPIEGEVELDSFKWNFRPAAGNHPKIRFATVRVGHSFAADPPAVTLQVSGTLTIERATEKELAGRLQLQSVGPGGGRVATPFSATRGVAIGEPLGY